MQLDLQIKTDTGWQPVILRPDDSLHIEDTNSIFDEEAGGAFSYPFNISIELNQHLFPTVTSHHGACVHDLLYHKPFKLMYGGFPLLYGIIDLDDEVEIEEADNGGHTVAINLASGNQELSALLEGLNAQDIPLKDKIPVGSELHSLDLQVETRLPDDNFKSSLSVELPAHEFSLNTYSESIDGSDDEHNSTNVDKPYPEKPYCNAMVAVQARDKQSDGSYKTLREYEVFDADRANSGLCFYVLYFLDCLFLHIKCALDNSALTQMEDFCRLAFFSTRCECDVYPTSRQLVETANSSLNVHEISYYFKEFTLGYHRYGPYVSSIIAKATLYTKYANSKNFPSIDASNIVKELQNAFGIRFLYDSERRRCRAIFIKDIFEDKTAVKSGAILHNAYHKDKNLRGVKLSYEGDDSTAYNYRPSDDNSVVVIKDDYDDIHNKQDMYDKTTYYDSVTGNMYRIKVDEDAKTEEELYPSLFEVGQYQDAWVGEIVDKDKVAEDAIPDTQETDFVKEIKVGFTPVISNLIEYLDPSKERKSTAVTSHLTDSTKEKNEVANFAVFIDKELESPHTQTLKKSFIDGYHTGLPPKQTGILSHYIRGSYVIIKFKARYAYTDDSLKRFNKEVDRALRGKRLKHTLLRFEEDPLATYDAGFTLGVMRGPGNAAGVEVSNDNYDGFGNAQWTTVPKGYAFTADSIDLYGRPYDYNGEQSGGTSTEGRFSLKLQAEKRRGYSWTKDANGNVVVSTRKEAEFWLSDLFRDSHKKLTDGPQYKVSAFQAAGWDTSVYSSLGEYSVIFPVMYALYGNGTHEYIMCTPASSNELLSRSKMDDYIDELQAELTETGDFSDYKGLIIKRNIVVANFPDEANNLINLTKLYHSPTPIDPITLQGASTYDSDFYPISSQNAHRGLLHKFNYAFFQFLIHSRIIVLDLTMTLQEIRSVDKTKWYTFGPYTGLIERLEYDISNDKGLSHVTVTLRYLP